MLKMNHINGAYNGLAPKIKFIKGCYLKSLTDPRVRSKAEQVAGRGSRKEQAKNLFAWLREKMVYTRDPVGVEMTKSPSVLLGEIENRGQAYGDCDDHACMAHTMLKSIGIPSKLRVGWYGKTMPQHIYALAELDNQWYPFDTTRAKGFGGEPSNTKAMDF